MVDHMNAVIFRYLATVSALLRKLAQNCLLWITGTTDIFGQFRFPIDPVNLLRTENQAWKMKAKLKGARPLFSEAV